MTYFVCLFACGLFVMFVWLFAEVDCVYNLFFVFYFSLRFSWHDVLDVYRLNFIDTAEFLSLIVDFALIG